MPERSCGVTIQNQEGRLQYLKDGLPHQVGTSQFKISDHLGNLAVLFSDGDNDGHVTSENEAGSTDDHEVLQRHFYYAFGMDMDGTWTRVEPYEDRYRYNHKELVKGLGWYAYGARHYDPAIGRFTGVDPISEKFAHVTTYNYAENEPVGHVDLWGLQKSLSLVQLGKNSSGENFVIQAAEVQMPTTGAHNHLYSVYAKPEKYGTRGRLTVFHNIDTGVKVEKFELGFWERVANFFDSQDSPAGGMEFTWDVGKGLETRSNPDAEIGPDIGEIMDAFGTAKSIGDLPAKKPGTVGENIADLLQWLHNSFQVGGTLQGSYHGGDNQGRGTLEDNKPERKDSMSIEFKRIPGTNDYKRDTTYNS